MSFKKRLTKVYSESEKIPVDGSTKMVFISDCHRGDASSADNLYQNENIYYHALKEYYRIGFTYVEIGDGDDLWENKRFADIANAHVSTFKLLRKFHDAGRLHMLFGNHDMIKSRKKWRQKNLDKYFDEQDNRHKKCLPDIAVKEGLTLQKEDGKGEIFLVHGHQADFLNYDLWRLSQFLVRYVWKPLKLVGIKDPGSANKNHTKKMKIERILMEWAKENNKILVAGHTHRYVFPEPGEPTYFNDGCCVHLRSMTAIEFENNKLSLVMWSVKSRADGVLQVQREVLCEPVDIGEFINFRKI